MKTILSNRLWILVLTGALIFVIGCETQQETPEPAEAAEEEAVQLPVQLTEAWTLGEGLDRPESAIYDSEREVIYLSNLVGEGDAMDGVGYLSKVGLDGAMIEQEWVSGLNAPKGLTLHNGMLYGTDINAVVEIDPETGEILNRYEVDTENVYLNDISGHPDGSLYVTDSRYSKIYRLHEGALTVWLENASFQMPNGIHVMGDELYIVAGDTTAENPGAARYMQAVSLTDQRVRAVQGTDPEGALDAVEPDEKGGIFVTDWGNGRLMYFNDQGLTLLEQLGQGAADAEYVAATGMLYVPVMQEGQLIAYKVE